VRRILAAYLLDPFTSMMGLLGAKLIIGTLSQLVGKDGCEHREESGRLSSFDAQ
jgi:hypothetical protein